MDDPFAQIDAALAYFLEICPPADDLRRRLYQGAIEEGGLLASDFFTLRDWLELTGYQEHAALHAVLILLLLALEEGSLCLELTEANLQRRLSVLVGPGDAQSWARLIVAEFRRQDFSALVGTSKDAGTPLVRQNIDGRDFLFFQKYLRHELDFLAAFQERLQQGIALPGTAKPEGLGPILREVLVDLPLIRAGQPLILDADQQAALGLALLRPLVIISGGPGTGKTSLVLTVLRCLARCGIAPERMALAALTGRAAQRLGDAIRQGLGQIAGASPAQDTALVSVQAGTLHKLLEYQPSRGRFRRHRENPIPADLVVIDEVSMVGMHMMAQLFQALTPGTRILLLGDKDQLPSVDAGAVLAHLLPHGTMPGFSAPIAEHLRQFFPQTPGPWQTPGPRAPSLFDDEPLRDSAVLLRTNHRSEPGIRAAAEAVNVADVTILERLPRHQLGEWANVDDPWQRLTAGCHFLEATTTQARELKAVLQSWTRHAYVDAERSGKKYLELAAGCSVNARDEYDGQTLANLKDLFALLERARLLTLVRESSWGAVEVNRFCERLLREELGLPPGKLAPGTPILITQNDHARQLYNGDVGIALGGADGLRVVFPRGAAWLSFPVDSLPGHELGFALTVHKSQGSEYDEVLMIFPPKGARRLLRRELVYTGLTRARRLAVLFGRDEVIRQAITSRVEREAGWLRTLHGLDSA